MTDLEARAAQHAEHVALLQRLYRFSEREAQDYLDMYPVDKPVDEKTFHGEHA